MKEPTKIPINPNTPKAKDVKKIPMPPLRPMNFEDIMPDNDSVYTTIENTILDNNENYTQNNKKVL